MIDCLNSLEPRTLQSASRSIADAIAGHAKAAEIDLEFPVKPARLSALQTVRGTAWDQCAKGGGGMAIGEALSAPLSLNDASAMCVFSSLQQATGQTDEM